MRAFLLLCPAFALSSCLMAPIPPEEKPKDIVPKPAPPPEVQVKTVTVVEPAAPPVTVLRTFDAEGKPTGEHRAGTVVIDRPGHFAEFTDATGKKRLYIRESKITITAER
jgi:hypothetical protein